jgi:hypothetical protein
MDHYKRGPSVIHRWPPTWLPTTHPCPVEVKKKVKLEYAGFDQTCLNMTKYRDKIQALAHLDSHHQGFITDDRSKESTVQFSFNASLMIAHSSRKFMNQLAYMTSIHSS